MTAISTEWGTPGELFDCLNQAFDFTLDACATPDNAKCPRFFSPQENSLAQEWRGRIWLNPPYGRGIDAWLRKAIVSAQAGALVVALLPARTDTAWWQDLVAPHALVYYLRGRLVFEGAPHNAPFGSALAIYFPKPDVQPNQRLLFNTAEGATQ